MPFGKMAKTEVKPRIIVVTGMSGAGKSTALHAFEDLGFEAVDNLPISLLTKLLKIEDGASARPLAIGIDSRTRAFNADQVLEILKKLRRAGRANASMLFMECSDEELTRRYSETRRRHPLALDRPVADGIAAERPLLRHLRENADLVLDTSSQTVHDTRARLIELYSADSSQEGRPALNIVIKSFGFSRGLPRDADLVFDVRFLRNPHYDEALRPLTGLDERVAAFVHADENYATYFRLVEEHLLTLCPLYQAEGKAYLTVAFGCTGGRHRSVALAEAVGKLLESKDYRVNILHRDARES